MRSRPASISAGGVRRGGIGGAVMLAALVLTGAVLAGCGRAEEVTIQPLPAASGQADLGPGARALSSGPGYKSSPSWSPDGGRIAFTVDGYIVDRPIGPGETRRWTTRDFGAEGAEWSSADSLAILRAAPGSSASGVNFVYRARSGEESLGVEEIATGVLAMARGPGGDGLILAIKTGSGQSTLALADGDGRIERLYTGTLDGIVTGVSLSPDGRAAILAVRSRGSSRADGASNLSVFDLRRGTHRRIARAGEGLEIFGAPQWTSRGIYFVAGEETSGQTDEPAAYGLYRVPVGSEGEVKPEPAPGVGKDFVAASIQVSPDAGRLAVVGRLTPDSPTNLLVLDPESEKFDVLTTNEDMEISTGPDDLAWSPDGRSVAIVARAAPSEEPRVRVGAAETLLDDFYNVYAVPTGGQETPR